MHLTLWIGQVLLALLFLFTGGSKLVLMGNGSRLLAWRAFADRTGGDLIVGVVAARELGLHALSRRHDLRVASAGDGARRSGRGVPRPPADPGPSTTACATPLAIRCAGS